MNNYLEAFRLNMKYYREQQGISQTQLSIICDCGTGTIGGIESGKAKPSFDMIIKISEALKIHPADLFLRNASSSKQNLRETLKQDFDKIISKL
jgi:transcriptional regulator with XRE-family HTH domain